MVATRVRSSEVQVAGDITPASSDASSVTATEDSGVSVGRLTPVTPLPKLQMAVLCLVSFSEPISSFVIFPFVNEMIEFNGITNDPKRVGYYTGLIECLFFVTQALTVLFWGSLSDRIGRKPVLMIGLVGSIMAITSFGFSTNLPMMIVSRCIAGALNGNSPVVRSVAAELTDHTNQALALAMIPTCWSIASILAPILGGFLSRPADNFPSIFGNWQLFIDYPYLLPCICGASISTMGLILGALFLEETLESKVQAKPSLTSGASIVNYGAIPNEDLPIIKPTAAPKASVSQLLALPTVRSVLISWVFVAFVTISIDAVWSLWMFTPVAVGGLSFTTAEIGESLSGVGILGGILGLLAFPPLQRRIGTKPIYVGAMMCQIIMSISFPIVHSIALEEAKLGLSSRAFTWAGVWVMVIIKAFGTLLYPCNMVIITNVVPSRANLGVVNSLAQTIASVFRAIGPVMSTSLFALTMSDNLLGGYFVWIYLGIISLMGLWACMVVIDPRQAR